MRYCMILLFAGTVACGEGLPVEDGASAGDETPAQVRDNDGDGYGRRYNQWGEVLSAQSSADDCEDQDPAVYPGAAAPDVPCVGPLWEDPA